MEPGNRILYLYTVIQLYVYQTCILLSYTYQTGILLNLFEISFITKDGNCFHSVVIHNALYFFLVIVERIVVFDHETSF